MNRVTVESALGRALAKASKEAEAAALRTRADSAVVLALAACGGEAERARFALVLLERCAEAVSSLHDGPRTQACLGRVAAKHGAELPGRNGSIRPRSEAEKLFRRGNG